MPPFKVEFQQQDSSIDRVRCQFLFFLEIVTYTVGDFLTATGSHFHMGYVPYLPAEGILYSKPTADVTITRIDRSPLPLSGFDFNCKISQ